MSGHDHDHSGVPPVESKGSKKGRVVTLAATQFACGHDYPANVANAERLVREAAAKGANVILLQELFETPYFCSEQKGQLFALANTCNPDENPLLKRFQRLSAELNVALPVSFFERSGNAHYNSVVCFDAGRYVGLYRKAHIPDGPGYQEKFFFNPGDTGFKVFHTQFGAVGVAICWDQWFPESARCMALLGAEMLFYPTAIGSEPQDSSLDSREHWQRVMQGHAGANLMPLVASNRIGKELEITFYGSSFIADPLGAKLVEASRDKEEVLVASFDLDALALQRRSWGVFRDRRPDLYLPLLTLDGYRPIAALTLPTNMLGVASHHNPTAPASVPTHHSASYHHVPALTHGYTTHVSTTSVDFSSSAEIDSTPERDGFRLPGEFEPHAQTWMLFPNRGDLWRNGAKHGQEAFAALAAQISLYEPVTVCAPPTAYETARRLLPARVRVVEMSQNDAWARDIAPLFVVNDRTGEVRAVDMEFNAWGGEHEGCYDDWSLDRLVKPKIADIVGTRRYKCNQVFEGGAIHVDGEGTLITTEECLLNPNRLLPGQKPETRTRAIVEDALRHYTGAKKIIWIPRGVYNDNDTNGHVDNLVCFVRPGEVALTWTDDTNDPQYAISQEAYKILSETTDARGRQLKIHKVHQPTPIIVNKEEAESFKTGPHEPKDQKEKAHSVGRAEGYRLAASYINFYIGNSAVYLPGFNDAKYDALAKDAVQAMFPDRRVVQLYSREIMLGGGNIHCITMQQPRSPKA